MVISLEVRIVRRLMVNIMIKLHLPFLKIELGFSKHKPLTDACQGKKTNSRRSAERDIQNHHNNKTDKDAERPEV